MPIERRYSDIFRDLQDKDYYAVPAERLPHIHYSKLAAPAQHNIYIMRQFGDPDMAAQFDADLTPHQAYYRDNGYLILRDFIPHDLIDAYLALRDRLGLGQQQFPDSTPFLEHREIRDILIYKPLMDVIRELHAAEMGLIFALTGFKSTKRGWHQDAYLDADEAVPRLASWIACGDVTPQVGPFEYVPGSHRWMGLSNLRINDYLKPDFHWPSGHVARKAGELGWGRISEAFIDPAVYAKIERDGAEVHEFTAKKGDVLLWYGRLMHRGSPPRQDGATRPGIIGHYAPIFERRRGYFAKASDGGRFICPPHKIAHVTSNR
jgi:ectoine hydroxylase-related dioxygenase (phytanoyl-CoA dioxygenase family)